MKKRNYFLFTLIIVFIDQATKWLVHFNMTMGPAGEISLLGEWLKLHYILNRGMAFGLSFGSDYGKLILTIFRLVAIGFIGYGLHYLHYKRYPSVVLWCVAAILAGAVGNLIDSIFFGVLFDNAPYNSITPWFHGQVIDMVYLDLWEGYLAEWIPFWGGRKVSLLPIFNIADVAIFAGVLTLLLKQKSLVSSKKD